MVVTKRHLDGSLDEGLTMHKPGECQAIDMLMTQLQAELDDNDRWMREVLTDFKIPFDDHKIGMRLAFTQWMADRLNERVL